MPPVAAALSISFWSTNDLRPGVWHGVLTPKKAILQLQMSLIGWALGRSLKLLQSIRTRFPANWTAQKEKDQEKKIMKSRPLKRVVCIYIYYSYIYVWEYYIYIYVYTRIYVYIYMDYMSLKNKYDMHTYMIYMAYIHGKIYMTYIFSTITNLKIDFFSLISCLPT